MNIIIQSPHFKANEKLEAFVWDKVNRLSHFNPRIIGGEVCLKLDKSDTHENKVCEIKLAIPGKDLFVKRQSHTFEEATNEAVDALQQQLKKRKTQINKGRTL